ncbi:MAG: hypothetical protein ABSG16_19800 [Candidatus Acidiferrum sp.]
MTREEILERLRLAKIRDEEQIKAGKLIKCPFCRQHQKIVNGVVITHHDLMAEDIDVPCKGSRRAVKTSNKKRS